MELLSREQEPLLQWIHDQPEPVCLQQMEATGAPYFTRQRVETLRKNDMLTWTYISYGGDMVAGYFLSDKGLAALQMQEQLRNDRAEERAENQRNRNTQIFTAIFGAVLGSVLTLFLEHLNEIVTFFQSISS